MNINPRSIYNKTDDFALLVDQYEADVICMSETWERPKVELKEILKLDNFEIISNVQQRDFQGGKPAILVNKEKFNIKRLCPDPIQVPTGVEAVWCLIMPKNNSSNWLKYIAICSFYYRGPKSTKKLELFDHIAKSFHYLSAKYGSRIQFVIAGDANRLNLTPILNLSHSLEQVVKLPTRLNPPAILDPIITSLAPYYEEPVMMPPLNPNVRSKGCPSDHLTVLMRPLSSISATKRRVYRTVVTRPITASGLELFENWIADQTWTEVFSCKSADDKAKIFQKTIFESFVKCFPEKRLKISDDDQPWVTAGVKKLDRLRKREFFRHGKSDRWQSLNEEFLNLCKKEKEKYYQNIVSDLKTSNISQWYSKVKRMSGKSDRCTDVNIDEIAQYSDQDQAEELAKHYAKISQEYEPLTKDDFPEYADPSKFILPEVTPSKVERVIRKMNKKAAGVPGDIPMRIIAKFSLEFAKPLAHIINTCIKQGVYPEIWKTEFVTPVPKQIPPEKLEDFRRISGIVSFAKITDRILAEWISDDMAETRDVTQYGNRKKISIQHYLVKLLHKILKSLDINSSSKSMAVILTMVDWSKAFDRQSHKFGIQSFIENGVRPGLISILMSFFINRKMTVKWKGLLSSLHSLPGGGPQGDNLGIEEYLSQTNGNTSFLEEDENFKFIDDLSLLEILNLVSIASSIYEVEEHVPSDIGIDNKYIDSSNIKTQDYLDKIQDWTYKKKMKLNVQKTDYMIFNFSKENQFNTRLKLEDTLLNQVHSKKLLGLIISDDLSWKANTASLVKRAYSRMIILKNLYSFGVPLEDLVEIYTLYIRSVLEQSAVVWNSSITQGEKLELERVQKVALRIILKDQYSHYSNALNLTGLETLSQRREKLSLNFARKCVRNPLTQDMFPLNRIKVNTRRPEKYHVPFARTDRYGHSAIPYMSRLLNKSSK